MEFVMFNLIEIKLECWWKLLDINFFIYFF